MGPIKQVKPKELEEWLRKISPVAFVHIIKKSLKRVSTYLTNVPLKKILTNVFFRYGHLHFNSYQESSAFYNLMKNVIKEGPYGKIRFTASFFSTKKQVAYMKVNYFLLFKQLISFLIFLFTWTFRIRVLVVKAEKENYSKLRTMKTTSDLQTFHMIFMRPS